MKRIPIKGKELSIREDEPVGWFEDLYSAADTEGQGVPWASMETHAAFTAWLHTHPLEGAGASALVVGCGMGDDAIELESRGFAVTAFDVSASAIAYSKERFPATAADFVQADLFDPPAEWRAKYDFVLEIYTVQAVPPIYETKAIANIAAFVAPGGRALVVAEVGAGERSFEKGPPWLLTPQHVEAFASHGLRVEERHVEPREDEGAALYVTTFARPR
ncbi:MAG: class I SAM-dependent methyltransferase [Myxococcota bacterium]